MKTAFANYSSNKIGRWPISLLILGLLSSGIGARLAVGQQQGLYTDQGQTPDLLPQAFPPTVPAGGSYAGATSSTTSPNSDATSQSTNGTTQNLTQAQRLQQESVRNQQRILGLRRKPALTEFQQMVAATTGRTLPIFGASTFLNALPSTFSPVSDVPVTPDYVVGPGDELRLQIWGQVSLRGSYTVDRTGSIALPGAGTIHVAGVRFDHLTDFLRSHLARVYRNFDLNVNMGQLRSIQVFVVGEANMPGSYTVGSLSTLLNALFYAGGPKPQGSLRDIQLKRGGKTIDHFDLYDVLLQGDKSNDVQLASGDVIFIPPAGKQIAVVGSVNNPAIYELRNETTIEQVLQLAGGRTNIAVNSQARVERIYDHAVRSVMEVNLSQPSTFQVQDGDIVTVNAIVDRFKDAVTLRGNVANPGRYAWHPGMRVSDLIPNKDALITRSYWQHKNDLGHMTMNYEPEPERNARGVLQPKNYYGSTTQDSTTQALNGTGLQQSQGAQNQAGLDQNQYGTEPEQYGVVQDPYSADQYGSLQSQSNFPPNQPAPAGGQSSSTTTPQMGAQAQGSSDTSTGGNSVGAALTGNVGRFPVKTNVLLSAPDIDWSYAVIERQNGENLKTSLLPFNLGRVILDGNQSQNLELLPGDVVTIFSTADIRVPISEQTRFVRLEGEFVSSGVYSVKPGETLRQLLEREGGFTPDAYLYASAFTRESTRRVQQQRLNEYADQLEVQSATAAAAGNASAVNAQDAAAATAAASAAQTSIAQLRRSHPDGRIVLQLKPDSRGIDSVPDLALEDGDQFVVPKVPATVSVEGEVYSANAFIFRREERTIDYLREAGGPDRQADMKHAFVLRADGSVYSQQYGNIKKATIFPGDTIVIPPQLQRMSIMRNLIDIGTIVSQFGIGIAAINLLK
ncbi:MULTISPECIES: SLBB domain-containing protein [Acidobacteriaceae]|uniref:SLBB domain-containing protein n=1 Tax=Acidobacteriaceae TaxID=204434 RepID=UPI00131C48A0|nr:MULTISPECIES: polysaccharide biosynthesis/export family protein [Acidobacteriaceae]MDW5266809.1 polysaccharide biosynthesis/export family protein [Edaphobacter sp.]